MLSEIVSALEETLFMVFSAGLITWCLGLPLGILLKEKTHSPIFSQIYRILSIILNSISSIPYILLMIALIPISRNLFGQTNGCMAGIIPLAIIAMPFFAQSTEKALTEVPKGIIDLAVSIGATHWQLIYKILIPEALPKILQALIDTFIRLVGYSLLAGALGCGGLGSLAIEKGFGSGALEKEYIIALIVVSAALIQIIQRTGTFFITGKLHQRQLQQKP